VAAQPPQQVGSGGTRLLIADQVMTASPSAPPHRPDQAVFTLMGFRTVIFVSLALVLGACGDDEQTAEPAGDASSPATPSPSETPTPTASSTEPMSHGTVVTTADSQFGEILFDGAGQAIYLFDKEETTEAECYEDCAVEWPPVLTEGDPVAESQIAPDRLGTTQRTDGSTQVTYAGHPLYYYAHERANEVKCHNVHEFGGLWLAVTPSGDPAA
jgi:predicted lipoprotein with Yx(FWY)xxD motif